MTGCTGLIKLAFPQKTKETIEEAFKNTATPVDSFNIRYCGKLGAGIPSVQMAMEYLSAPQNRFNYHNSKLPKGVLVFNSRLKSQKVDIRPDGAYQGFFMHIPNENIVKLKGNIMFYAGDSLWKAQAISSLTKNFFIPGSSVTVEINTSAKTARTLKIQYNPKTIDSTKLYCSDISYFSKQQGEFTDGSRDKDYANFCDCKWLITVAQGKRIKIEFPEFDTQAKTDFVWLFDGDKTIPEYIIAKFSGPNIPPAVKSATNMVLVWFVTDGFVTGKGWKLKYTEVD